MAGAYICSGITVLFAVVFIFFRLKKLILPQLIFKTMTGLGFVFTAIYASFYNGANPLYCALIISGAVFGLMGDIFLQLKYLEQSYFKQFLMLGMGFFAIGHFFYFAALSITSTLSIYPFLGAVVMVIFCYVGLSTKRFEKVGKIKPYACLYYFVLSVTLFQSVFAFVYGNSTSSLLFLIGASLFFLSDTILAFIYFARADRRRFTIINLTTYYLAQLSIALSILFIAA